MAALTPSSTVVMISGNRVQILGAFTAANDGDTWTPGLTTVEAAILTNGAHTTTHGTTFSGGTITVAASAALANATVLAIGV